MFELSWESLGVGSVSCLSSCSFLPLFLLPLLNGKPMEGRPNLDISPFFFAELSLHVLSMVCYSLTLNVFWGSWLGLPRDIDCRVLLSYCWIWMGVCCALLSITCCSNANAFLPNVDSSMSYAPGVIALSTVFSLGVKSVNFFSVFALWGVGAVYDGFLIWRSSESDSG